MAASRTQRTCDPRLVEFVRAAGDPTLVTRLGVPRSTAAGWIRARRRSPVPLPDEAGISRDLESETGETPATRLSARRPRACAPNPRRWRAHGRLPRTIVQRAGKPRDAAPEVIHVKGTPLSNSSVNRDVCLIAAALNRLVRLDLLEKNPVKRVRRGREPLRSRVVLSKEEIAHLLEACGPPLRLLAMAAFLTGQRPSELKAVRWGDVNLEDGTLSVFRKKVGLGGSIPLHPRLASELREVKKRRFSERGTKIPDDEHVFLSRAGTPYKDYRTSWLNALRRAGLDRRPGLTFYSLRHSFATHFLEKGSPADLLVAGPSGSVPAPRCRRHSVRPRLSSAEHLLAILPA